MTLGKLFGIYSACGGECSSYSLLEVDPWSLVCRYHPVVQTKIQLPWAANSSKMLFLCTRLQKRTLT